MCTKKLQVDDSPKTTVLSEELSSSSIAEQLRPFVFLKRWLFWGALLRGVLA
jgi:hypothetical protein